MGRRMALAGKMVLCAGLLGLADAPAHAQFTSVPGVGDLGEGAGLAITNLDGNPRPEMILMAYDAPSGGNSFRYKVGSNLNAAGTAVSWGPTIQVAGVGDLGAGADVAIVNLDGNARPEMILMAYDDPSGPNTFRYKVGFNLNMSGVATTWGPTIQVPGVGDLGQGAGIAFTNLDGNARPDMILMAYDAPAGANSFRYKVGFNLNTSGVAASWGAPIIVPGVGDLGDGAGVVVTNVDGNARPDMILMAYDAPSGPNNFRRKVGSNLNASGVAASWGASVQIPGFGDLGDGAGIRVFNVNGDGRTEMILMAYDDPAGPNNFRYRLIHDTIVPNKRIHLEMDKLSSVAWPPTSVVRQGATHTLESIYAIAGITLTRDQHEANIADLHPGTPYTDAELDSFRAAHMNHPPSPAGPWHMYGAFLTRHNEGIFGVMFDSAQRRGFAVFANEIGDQPRYLRTTAHELGHALNLEHSDGDATIPPGFPTAGQGRTIMNQTGTLATDWDYGWSAASLQHFYEHPEDRWRPLSGVTFTNCH